MIEKEEKLVLISLMAAMLYEKLAPGISSGEHPVEIAAVTAPNILKACDELVAKQEKSK